MIDTFNHALVGIKGDKIVVLNFKGVMTPDEAMNMAAYLVLLAEHGATHTFSEVYKEISQT